VKSNQRNLQKTNGASAPYEDPQQNHIKNYGQGYDLQLSRQDFILKFKVDKTEKWMKVRLLDAEWKVRKVVSILRFILLSK